MFVFESSMVNNTVVSYRSVIIFLVVGHLVIFLKLIPLREENHYPGWRKPGTWAVAASLFSSLALLVVKCCSFLLFQRLSFFHLCRYFFSMRLDLCYLIFCYQVFWKKNLSQNKNNMLYKFKDPDVILVSKTSNQWMLLTWNHWLLRNLVINDIYLRSVIMDWISPEWDHISIFTIWLKG